MLVDPSKITKESIRESIEQMIDEEEKKSWLGRSTRGMTLKDIVAKYDEDKKKFQEGELDLGPEIVFYFLTSG